MEESKGFDWEGLFGNKLLQQIMAAAGQDIGEGRPPGQQTGGAVMQNIAAQNTAALLREILGGSDSKMTLSNKGMQLNLPPDQAIGMFGSILGEGFKVNPSLFLQQDKGQYFTPKSFGAGLNLEDSPAPTQTTVQRTQRVNPFGDSQSGFPAIDPSMLAGLAPQDIMNIMGLGMQQKQMEQKRISDAVDMMYKQAQTEKLLSDDPLDRQFPITGIDGNPITHRQWNSYTTDQKEYAAYRHAMRGTEEAIMSPAEFKDYFNPTERTRFLREMSSIPGLADIHKAEKDLTQRTTGELTWNQALTVLDREYGSRHPDGQWVITPELRGAHSVAMTYLNNLRLKGEDAMTAANKAINFVKQIEADYWDDMQEVANITDSTIREQKQQEVNQQFVKNFGYLPYKRGRK